jgi:imidazolonepropionase-like amidohydrolase
VSDALHIRFGTLHDNLGAPKHNGTLVIEDGRVARIEGPEASATPETRTIEAACVVPGLINAHAHFEASGEAQSMMVFVLTTPTQRALACAANARKALVSGVTSVRDLGSTEKLAIDTRDAIAAGTIAGPNIVAAGRLPRLVPRPPS